MKFLLATLPLLATTTSAFQLSMMNNGNRSPLSHQYKSITSVHNSIMAGGGVRMSPPPGEPEPEVSFHVVYLLLVVGVCDAETRVI